MEAVSAKETTLWINTLISVCAAATLILTLREITLAAAVNSLMWLIILQENASLAP